MGPLMKFMDNPLYNPRRIPSFLNQKRYIQFVLFFRRKKYNLKLDYFLLIIKGIRLQNRSNVLDSVLYLYITYMNLEVL